MRFEDVAGNDLPRDEAARLQRVHELLVQAGPPPDLPPALASPAVPTDAEILQFPLLPHRRWAALAAAAAICVAAGFGGGYLVGHSKSKPAEFVAQRVIAMHGTDALAVLRIARRDSVGNWPMQFEVTGLPRLEPGAYYVLWATRGGKPVAPCGSFRVHDRTTRVRFSVPYDFSEYDGWVVTRQRAGVRKPGGAVLAT